ncbi:MAG: PKD-like family lipoprotein [Carboxylicivirga sp.]|nr:PKD-like family lipoprotein [Carboxylicivirga sp.]MCT4645130.1 PKD-like family lipoprotein [Carboxylicivirga sp.]
MKLIKYILIIAVAGVVSCSEDLGNYDYKQLNDVSITGLPTDTTVQILEQFVLKPVIEQALAEKEADLSFVWRIENDTVSTSKELDYVIPGSIKFGSNVCYFSVTDNTTGVQYYADFKMKVTSAFEFGYYILSEKEDESSIISYLPSVYEEDTPWKMTDMIGTIQLGKKPAQMTSKFSYMSEFSDYGWTFYFMTEEGEYQVIETNSFTFQPTSLVNNESYVGGSGGRAFAPTSLVSGNAATYYQTGDGFAIYSNGLLNPPADFTTDYEWVATGLWEMGQTIDKLWAFDKLSNQLYTVYYTESDPVNGIVGNKYLFDNIEAVEGFPSFDGLSFLTANIASNWSSDKSSNTQSLDIVLFNSSSIVIHTKKTVQECENWVPKGDPVITFEQLELPIFGADENSVCKIIDGDYYFLIGNSIYFSPALNPKLTKVVDIPSEIGVPVQLEMSVKGSKLWVATYNDGDSNDLKGSVIVIDPTNKVIEHTFKNVCGKAADIMTADGNPWW